MRGLSMLGLGLAALVGAAGGLGAYTFAYAEGLAYLSNEPAACKNCHLMNEQYDSWRKGPHRAVATCNDCHVPTDFFGKYLAKARNGYHHSVGFTFQSSTPDADGARQVFAEPVRIKPTNDQILQDNCLRCHGDLVHQVVRGSTWGEGAVRCATCHRGAGHGAPR